MKTQGIRRSHPAVRAVIAVLGVGMLLFWSHVMYFALAWGGFGTFYENLLGFGFVSCPLAIILTAISARRSVAMGCALVNIVNVFTAVYILVHESLLVGAGLCGCIFLWYLLVGIVVFRVRPKKSSAGGKGEDGREESGQEGG